MGGMAVSIILGYLLGSIPFGLLLSQAAGLGDIRKIGSGNIGATNVLRTGNKKIAALTLLCDLLKGFAPVALAAWWFGPDAGLAAGFAAMAGHIFPIWLGFKGGKGVATAAGVLLGWSWPVAIAGLATWIVVFLIRRISSLSAFSAAVAALIAGWFFDRPQLWALAVLALVIFVTHRANLARLMRGEEPRSSFSKAR
jgi:acyl phosphate:glycerol-3-phosphate acyltransferase